LTASDVLCINVAGVNSASHAHCEVFVGPDSHSLYVRSVKSEESF